MRYKTIVDKSEDGLLEIIQAVQQFEDLHISDDAECTSFENRLANMMQVA